MQTRRSSKAGGGGNEDEALAEPAARARLLLERALAEL